MLLQPSQQRAGVIVSTSERGRPVVTGGPVRTVRTDTGQIIRAGAAQIGINTTSFLFQDAAWAAGRALGLNTFRCGVNSATLSMPIGTLLSNIDLVVERARANRMYLMLGYFVTAPGTWEENVSANTTQWVNFWSAAAARYRDVPHVFFEMVNEPTAWGQISTYTADVRSGLKIVYDAMRSAAPDSLIVFLGAANLNPSAAQYLSLMPTFDSLGNGQPIDWNKTVLGHHYYNKTQTLAVSGNLNNATDNGEAGLRGLAAVYPLLCTETNWWVEETRLGLVDATDLYERIGLGWTLLRQPGQTSPYPTHPYGQPPLGPAFLDNKIAQLRDRGFAIPVE